MAKNITLRLIKNEDNTILTYVPISSASYVLGMSPKTLASWARAGAIRTLPRLRKEGMGICLLDATKLRLMTVNESLSRGITRTPKEYMVMSRKWKEERQLHTIPEAIMHGERWEIDDELRLVERVLGGASHEDIAIELGRTYEAVKTRVELLRRMGELPFIDHDGTDGWLPRTLSCLSLSEKMELGMMEVG